ncbi:MAG: glutathione S-transferase C-terminal domain-containing protein [Myxococcota bacterium]
MGYLRDGTWVDDEHWSADADGRFQRDAARFRRRPEAPFVPDPGRNHLVLAHACPWCHRTAIARALKGLEDVVSVSFVDPLMREGGWRFTADRPDPLFGASYAHELYTRAAPGYSGRVTVPILWDRATNTIVCNESEDIVRLFDAVGSGPSLRPEPLAAELDAINGRMYDAVNNGVYACGFARTQRAYEAAFAALFQALDALSERLRDRAFLVGDQLTEADLRLYVTLVRFDAVYFGHFKCNRNRIEEDPVLQRYLERLYAIPAFGRTTDFAEIKQHYYGSHRNLNPSGIVPVGPRLRLQHP